MPLSVASFCRPVLCIAALMAPVAAPAPTMADRPRPVPLRPSNFVLLAQELVDADPIRQWEFADHTLAALADSYRAELLASHKESRSTVEQRTKLARWQRGTQAVIDSLRGLRLRLAAGAEVAVRVDSRQQVLLIIDGEVVVVSGPRAETESEIERAVVERFCATNDCSSLHTASADAAASPAELGLWVLDQDSPPAFEIGDRLRFEFAELADRDLKAQAVRRAAEELGVLHDALQQAVSQGYGVDWDRLAESRPSTGPDRRVILNAEGTYLPLDLPHLARLGDADWQRVVAWLRRGGLSGGGVLAVRQADDLLRAASGE